MVEELYRWRPVPLRQRCDRCRETATVLFDSVFLCGECFFEASKQRFGVRESAAREIEDDQKKRATAG